MNHFIDMIVGDNDDKYCLTICITIKRNREYNELLHIPKKLGTKHGIT